MFLSREKPAWRKIPSVFIVLKHASQGGIKQIHLLQQDVKGDSLFHSLRDCPESRCLIKITSLVRGDPTLTPPPPPTSKSKGPFNQMLECCTNYLPTGWPFYLLMAFWNPVSLTTLGVYACHISNSLSLFLPAVVGTEYGLIYSWPN